MSAVAPLRTRTYWILLMRAAVIGVFGGVFGMAFLRLEHALVHAVWGDTGGYRWFGGGVVALTVPVAAGAIVGTLYLVLRIDRPFESFITELEQGHVDPRTAPSAVMISLASLVGGASLGPEAALVTGTGGFANWLTQRADADEEATRSATVAAASGVFGGLLSSPLIGTLLPLEMEHDQGVPFMFRHTLPGIVAGTAGFAVMYSVIGTPFFAVYDFPEFQFATWHLLAGLGLGVVGAVLGTGIGVTGRTLQRIASRLPSSPIVRALVGGVVLAAIGFAMPATLFSGLDTLDVAVNDPASIGVGLLILVAVLKMITLGTSLASGFYGGPFFPAFFIGGSVGAAIHVLIPDIPLAIAVGATMAATTAVAGIPFSVVIFASFVTAVGPPATAVIAIAVFVSFTILYGLGVVGPWSSESAEVAQKPATG